MELENLTESLHGPSRRRYEDGCGTAHALDLIGERWALLVMRELMLGPKRFSDIRADLPGISANTLTQRLEGLEKVGLVVREKLPPPASGQVYGLTEWGHQALPVMGALGRWAARSPDHDPGQHFSAVSLMLSFLAMNQPAITDAIEAAIGFRLGRENYPSRGLRAGRSTSARKRSGCGRQRLKYAPSMPHCRPMMKTRPQMTRVEETMRIPAWRSASPKKRKTRRP